MRRLLSRRVPAWVLVLTVYLSAAVALAQIAPSPVHPSSSGSGVATSVSAAAFPLSAPAAASPQYLVGGDTDSGMGAAAVGRISFFVNAVEEFRMVTAGLLLGSSLDASLSRVTTDVVRSGSSTTGEGWIQNEAGDQFLTANHTNATITPTNITDLTTNVTSGRKYTFQFVAKVDNSTDTDGLRFDFEGGTAAATDFWANCEVAANNVVSSTFAVTALATDMTAATLTGVGTFRCNGSFEPSSTGTFIPRAGTNTAVSGTLTTFRGSHLLTKDMP